jgi:hypothetical protein
VAAAAPGSPCPPHSLAGCCRSPAANQQQLRLRSGIRAP